MRASPAVLGEAARRSAAREASKRVLTACLPRMPFGQHKRCEKDKDIHFEGVLCAGGGAMSEHLREQRTNHAFAASGAKASASSGAAMRRALGDNNENVQMSADSASRGHGGARQQGRATNSHQPDTAPSAHAAPQHSGTAQSQAFTGLERPMGGLSMANDTAKLAQLLHRRLSLGGHSAIKEQEILEALRGVDLHGGVSVPEGVLQQRRQQP